MNNYNEVKKSFGTQAEKFASYHMSKAEYTGRTDIISGIWMLMSITYENVTF